MAARRAARAVQAGDATIVACLAGDTANEDSFRELMTGFSVWSRDAVWPYAAGGPNMSFALLTDSYMRANGATREAFGHVAIAQRINAAANDRALLRKPVTMDDYLAARPVCPPIHLLDCVMPCAGADGFLVMARTRAESLGIPYVRLLAAIERHNAFPDDAVQHRGGWVMDRDALWAQAGAGPADMDMVQTYDDYPVISMLQFEGLGFCPQGEAAGFLRGKDLTIHGDLPHNTGGGQLSCGQAGAAGGYLGLVEAMRAVARGARTAGAERTARAGQRLRHDQLRPRRLHRCRRARRMTRATAMRPMDEAASRGQVALQRCEDCGAGQYPPRELCHACLSDRLAWSTAPDAAGDLLACATVCHSLEPGTALPRPVGLVRLGPAMTALCFVDSGTQPGAVTVRARLDAGGRAVFTAC